MYPQTLGPKAPGINTILKRITNHIGPGLGDPWWIRPARLPLEPPFKRSRKPGDVLGSTWRMRGEGGPAGGGDAARHG